LLAGKYDDCWQILGNVIHCETLDQGHQRVAKGYLAPPAISMTKLYNFSKIIQWTNCPQRLHWGEISFKGEDNRILRLCDELSWDRAIFRCLHVAFLQRSSLQTHFKPWHTTRYNPSELIRNAKLDWSLGWKHVIKQIFLYPLTRLPRFDYKYRRYRRGGLVTVSSEPFMTSPSLVADKLNLAVPETVGKAERYHQTHPPLPRIGGAIVDMDAGGKS